MKKILKITSCIVLVTFLFTPVTVSAENTTKIINSSQFISKAEATCDMDVEIVDSVPNNVISKKFDTWEEALIWIEQLDAEVEKTEKTPLVTSFSTPGLLNDGFEMIGDYGWCAYSSMPSGTGSVRKYNSFNVPGASAQTVNASYYFNYGNGKVTNSSGAATISGLGLATFSINYNNLEQYGAFFSPNYYHIIRGNLGYYINVNGVDIGVYKLLELDYCLWNSKPIGA